MPSRPVIVRHAASILHAAAVDTNPKRQRGVKPFPRLHFGLVWDVSFLTANSIKFVTPLLVAVNLVNLLPCSSGREQPPVSTEALGYDQNGHAGEKPEAHDHGGICERRRR